jgi:hypothetical protein
MKLGQMHVEESKCWKQMSQLWWSWFLDISPLKTKHINTIL